MRNKWQLAILSAIFGIVITVSPVFAGNSITVDEILEYSQQAVMEIEDIQADVDITQHTNKRANKTVAKLQASVVHQVARVELSEPSALRGQIIVADQADMKVRIYMPIADSIMVQSIEAMAEDQGFTGDLLDVTSLFDFSDYSVSLLEVIETEEAATTYLLQVEGFDEYTQKVYVTSDTWLPNKIEIYEDNTLTGVLKLDNLQINKDLAVEQLRALPKVREISR